MTVLFGLAGCNEEKPATFDQINGIYFNNRLLNNTIVDSTNVTFVYTSADTMTVTVKVQALGRPVAYARPIDISVAGGNAIEGTDYELVSVAEMPAEAVNLDYNVQLNRTAVLKQENRVRPHTPRARGAEGAARKYFSGDLDARSQDQRVLVQLVHLSYCHGSEIRAAGCFFDFFHLCCTFGLLIRLYSVRAKIRRTSVGCKTVRARMLLTLRKLMLGVRRNGT